MYDEDSKPSKGMARQTARNLLKTAKITKFPILLKEVAKFVPELKVDGVELDDSISGIQVTYKGKSFIAYNTRHATTRKRFTVAHEIGHILLGHTSCNQGNGNSSPLEVEANQFAAELLMPLALLKETMKTTTTVSTLARQCWVSKDAMSNRVMEMNLFNKLTSWN